MTPETIHWIPVTERLPDDDVMVLVAIKDSDEPVWLGYVDSARTPYWRAADGAWFAGTVTAWAPMPRGPGAADGEISYFGDGE